MSRPFPYCIHFLGASNLCRATLQIEEKIKRIEEKLSEMSDITKLIDIPDGVSLPRNIDINQSIAEYYSTKHDMEELE